MDEIVREFIQQNSSSVSEIRSDDLNKINAMKPEESLEEILEKLRNKDKLVTPTISIIRVKLPK